MKKEKILHVVFTLNTGGLEMVVKNILLSTKESFDNSCLVCYDSETDFEAELKDNGINVYHVPTPDSSKIKFYKNLLGLFGEHGDFDIVHVHMSFSNGVVAKAAKKSGIKTVISHSHETERKKDKSLIKRLYSFLMRRMILKNADVYMACSTSAGNFLYTEKIFREKGKVLYNGVRLSRFVFNREIREKERRRLGLENKIVLGNVGSLFPVKNQIKIVKMLKFNPSFAALIVGEGNERAALTRLAEEEGVSDRLILPGKTSQVEFFLNAMDVFVFPSVSEGFGIALIEAQANGLPCLASQAIIDDAVVNDNVIRLNLDESDEKWAEEALKLAEAGRVEDQSRLRERRLDLEDNMRNLMSFYTDLK